MDPRLEEINRLLINYSMGEFDNKINTSDKQDEIDAFISNINMLGEELKISTISRNYFNNIFNSVSDMLFVLDNSGLINSTNRAGTEKLGYAENKLKESSIGIITKEKSHFFDFIKKELDRYAEVISFDSNLLTAKGKEVPVNCSCSYLFNQNKEKIGYLLIARDQSILRKYEQSLIESETKYRNVFEKSSDCLFIISHEGKLIDINDAGVQLLKFPKETLYTKTFFDLISDTTEKELFEKELRTKEFVVDFKLKIIDKYNSPINCLVSVSKAYNKMGEPVGYQGIVKDMSRQREIENLLVRTVLDTQEAERNRVAKDLHDSLGQKLSGIKFHIEALKAMQKNAADTKYDAILTRSKDALNDALVELSNISFNIMPGTLQNFGLSYAIKELCTKLKLGSTTLFEVSIEDSFPALDKALEMTIFRIVQEFINNSIKHGNAAKISIHMDAAIIPGSVFLHLQDNGKGFDTKKITKPGMGLKNMKSRVDSYNGTLNIDSKEGWGTKYEILIPYTNIAK
ncbi:MAG TPA: PAS domain S-box protein [Bacteroidia bacterium]|jgi:PAS domain S-box-containing protein|nr:PAS domain S-box protein [Bacteroidia bacterium]